MRIGIDIDDTTVVTVNGMIKYADIFDTQILGRNGINGNFGLINNRYYLQSLYGWTDEEKHDFFARYYEAVLKECSPMVNAPEVIRKLKDTGNEIYFITARLISVDGCDTETITKNTLDSNNIPYDYLIINASDKLRYCIENKIDIFIEDSFETCKTLEEKGIKTYLMTTKMNEEIDTGKIERIFSWDELYEKITKYITSIK